MAGGGPKVGVWDLLSGGRSLHCFENHQKDVTCLCLDGTGTRLLSGGAEGQVKVYSMQALQLTHGLKFSSPVTALSLSCDNRKLAVGTLDASGSLIVRNRAPRGTGSTALSDPSVRGSQTSGSNSWDRHMSDDEGGERERGRFYQGAGAAVERRDDTTIETQRPVRLKPYETYLKKFQYGQALDAALHTHNPLVVVTVLEELSRRSGLTIALSSRDETALEPLLAFLTRYITHPRYAVLLSQIAHRILDLYGSVLGQSDTIDVLVHKLHSQIKSELQFHREIMRVNGSLDGIINTASALCRVS
eukprot:CAMPEP_0182419288 /NCGR_PEP_ID=MMETSP1167-20130531/3748_1 /TAXON_ID=2988 /ORGANISM="Mallomonas Sp, Strain CCMP3275" /LENGTH=302 /DNA_ID=CAMNT_0024594107 /DNA_START=588 /DNA_END=1492 /DNA_ORIENTATION=-